MNIQRPPRHTPLHPSPPLDPARRRGAAAGLTLIVLIILALVVGVWWIGPWGASGGDDQGTAATGAQAFDQRVEELAQRFSLAIQNQRPTAVFLPQARELAAAGPDSAPVQVLLGQVLMHNGRLDEAADALGGALAIEPDQPKVRELAGDIAATRQDYPTAITHYAQAVSLRPRDPGYRLKLANIHLLAGDLTAARDAALTAIRLDANHHAAYMLLSQVYEQQGQPGMAQSQMMRAIALLPGEDEATRVIYIRRRAAMLRRANDPAQALAALQELPPALLFEKDVAADLATTYAMLGQPGLAAQHYQTLVQIDPTDADSAAQSARWFLKADDPVSARTMLTTLRRINPRHEAVIELERDLPAPPPTPAPGSLPRRD